DGQSLCVSIYRRTGELPLVTGWLPFIGITLDYVAKPLGFLRKTQKKYGNVFTCKIAGKYFTFVADHFSFSIVMRQSKHLDFQKFAVGFSHQVSDSIPGGGGIMKQAWIKRVLCSDLQSVLPNVLTCIWYTKIYFDMIFIEICITCI
uniref:Uncharacterized protein n=1 Tax=Cyprinus carpio carpio TaxID=630221 RepID=A0A9J7XQY3_CYPCA